MEDWVSERDVIYAADVLRNLLVTISPWVSEKEVKEYDRLRKKWYDQEQAKAEQNLENDSM